MRRAGRFALALIPFLVLSCAGAAGAIAQDAPSAPDSAAAGALAPDSAAAIQSAPQSPAEIDFTPKAPTATAPPKAPASTEDERLDRDRFEWGVAVVEGYFDWLGTFGYRRFVREAGPFQQSIELELAGAKKDYLSEGSASLVYLFRPLRTIHPEWRVRPILEFGPGGHIVVQVADIEGFDDTGFHTHAFAKVHAFAGLEMLISHRWGILIRGRFTAPADRPLDYAQAAIFLR